MFESVSVVIDKIFEIRMERIVHVIEDALR